MERSEYDHLAFRTVGRTVYAPVDFGSRLSLGTALPAQSGVWDRRVLGVI